MNLKTTGTIIWLVAVFKQIFAYDDDDDDDGDECGRIFSSPCHIYLVFPAQFLINAMHTYVFYDVLTMYA